MSGFCWYALRLYASSQMNFTYKILAILNILVTTWRCVNRWTSEGQQAASESLYKINSLRTIDSPHHANPQSPQDTAIGAPITRLNYLSTSPTIQSP